eukprot:CAMPEP_0175121728 /NCGR_PEP_ID=MMETSP0087-20121206/1324_1 /TAXON_ID=136419 /ORGANISM="Unknown Unknown, Strain D1" /LENGTH=581 /DNA_ID=CAMNT_0016403291 /DNA_START=1 /DNA_END=1746 /DNA_ORIENTATION=-
MTGVTPPARGHAAVLEVAENALAFVQQQPGVSFTYPQLLDWSKTVSECVYFLCRHGTTDAHKYLPDVHKFVKEVTRDEEQELITEHACMVEGSEPANSIGETLSADDYDDDSFAEEELSQELKKDYPPPDRKQEHEHSDGDYVYSTVEPSPRTHRTHRQFDPPTKPKPGSPYDDSYDSDFFEEVICTQTASPPSEVYYTSLYRSVRHSDPKCETKQLPSARRVTSFLSQPPPPPPPNFANQHQHQQPTPISSPKAHNSRPTLTKEASSYSELLDVSRDSRGLPRSAHSEAEEDAASRALAWHKAKVEARQSKHSRVGNKNNKKKKSKHRLRNSMNAVGFRSLEFEERKFPDEMAVSRNTAVDPPQKQTSQHCTGSFSSPSRWVRASESFGNGSDLVGPLSPQEGHGTKRNPGHFGSTGISDPSVSRWQLGRTSGFSNNSYSKTQGYGVLPVQGSQAPFLRTNHFHDIAASEAVDSLSLWERSTTNDSKFSAQNSGANVHGTKIHRRRRVRGVASSYHAKSGLTGLSENSRQHNGLELGKNSKGSSWGGVGSSNSFSEQHTPQPQTIAGAGAVWRRRLDPDA